MADTKMELSPEAAKALKKAQFKNLVVDYIFIALGVTLLGFAIIAFWQPHNLVTGGISGLAIIVFYYTSNAAGFDIAIPIWLSNLILNLPLFALGFKIMPREYFVRSFYGYIGLTISLYLLRHLPFVPVPSDLLTASIFGGVVAGVGIGLILRARATTGGTTLIAAILHRWLLKHVSIAKSLFICDTIIILVGFLMFGPVNTMYAIIAVFVATKVTDTVVEGMSFSKAAFIISQNADEIATKINTDMERGVTEVFTRGRYSKLDQTMLLCVVPVKEIVTLKQMVYQLDEKAFVIVTDVREVLGEGFKPGKDAL